MGPRMISLLIVALLFTVGVPFFVAKNLQLGKFAKSPQEVTMTLGSTTRVAGGRASLWYAGGDTGSDFEIRCSQGGNYFHPSYNEPCEACGVTVELLEIKQDSDVRPPKAKFEVSWEE